MQLTDKEKLIIASLYLQKQTNSIVSLHDRVKMVQAYRLSLDVKDTTDLYENIQIEEMNFIAMITLMGVSFVTLEPSTFTNYEKFIIYQTELLLVVGDMPYAVKVEFCKKIADDLGIREYEKHLKLIADECNELEKFIIYLSKAKNP